MFSFKRVSVAVVVVIHVVATRGCIISHYFRIDMTKLNILHDYCLFDVILIFKLVFIGFV